MLSGKELLGIVILILVGSALLTLFNFGAKQVAIESTRKEFEKEAVSHNAGKYIINENNEIEFKWNDELKENNEQAN